MFEYKVVEFKYKKEEELEEKLNYFAQDNWENVQVVLIQKTGTGAKIVNLIFKRKKE